MNTPPDRPDDRHQRPEGVDTDVVIALGKLTEALETVERARGHLYEFHQLTGAADAKLAEALAILDQLGRHSISDRLRAVLLGRNVLAGRWTFQVVEEYDDGYWSVFRDEERRAREELLAGRRHVAEAEMKERERTRIEGTAAPWHAARPESGT
ncbi:hypothetical protein [Parasphingorhabdus pacifica]